MVAIYLGIGSNIDPIKNIENGKNELKKCFPRIQFSRHFESESIGFKGDNFINLVAKFEWELSDDSGFRETSKQVLSKLLARLKNIENQLGRETSDKKFSARTLDIDILLFGELVTDDPIELPRAEILENAYVLWPLSEIAPDVIHPVSSKSYLELWGAFDQGSQKLKPI